MAHTVLNMCLFPALFFFYALYYTDVASTFSVLYAYYCHLKKQKKRLFLAGLVSLWFRQTNIFWVAIFMGGLGPGQESRRTGNRRGLCSNTDVPRRGQWELESRLYLRQTCQ